jgi:protein phosphatase
VNAANRYVLDSGRAIPDRRGMGTTLSALMLVQQTAYLTQVGDSRIYRLRDGTLEQLSHDHTFVEEQVRAGILTPEQAESHPYAHVLTRAIGAEETVVPDVEAFDLKPHDRFLLCSDGLTGHVDDQTIAAMLGHAPSEAAWRLVNAALLGGGRDNCTVLVVRVDAMEPA